MNFYALSALANIIILTILIIVILIKRKESRPLNYFNIFNLFALGWSIGYFFWQISGSYETALFWVKFLMFSAMWASPAFFHFTAVIANKESRLLSWIILSYIINIPFIYLNFTSPLFISGLETKLNILFFPSAGIFFSIFLFQWAVWFLWSFTELFNAWKTTYEEKERKLLKNLFITTFVAILAGSVNYFLWYNIPVPPITTAIFGIYGITVAYLLLKKDL